MAHFPLRKPVDFTSLAGVPQTGAKCWSTNFCMAAIRSSNSTPIGVLARLKQAIVGPRLGYAGACMDEFRDMDFSGDRGVLCCLLRGSIHIEKPPLRPDITNLRLVGQGGGAHRKARY